MSEGRDGQAVRHPAVMVANAASSELRAWAVQLGLTPAARQRMTVPQADDGLETEMLFGQVPASRGGGRLDELLAERARGSL